MNFYIYTLGCKVNTYESNIMRDILLNHGYKENENADVVIVNTCTVTNTSDSKSLKIIRQVAKKNPDAIIIVAGCMSQVNSDKLKDIKEISIVIGNKNKTKIIDYIEKFKKEKKQIIDLVNVMDEPFETMILNNFNRTRAFVKIEDGCENYCSYCIIPYSRGKVKSKDPKEALDEIEQLVKQGHKEIVLTGIHTGHYGGDLENFDFADLLNEIIKIKGLDRLRISSIEITEVNEKVLDVFRKSNILVDHMHIPLQTGNDKILKLMNRKYDMNYFFKKINEIRSIRPNISITTDVIVGFPGETEEDFNETVTNIKKIKFTKVHVFPFSVRKGTKAENMPNHIDEVTKKKRVHELLQVSKELEIEYMNKFLNQEVEFIPETKKDGFIIGHTGNYLLIKVKDDNLIHEVEKIKIDKIEYPYCIGVKIC